MTVAWLFSWPANLPSYILYSSWPLSFWEQRYLKKTVEWVNTDSSLLWIGCNSTPDKFASKSADALVLPEFGKSELV